MALPRTKSDSICIRIPLELEPALLAAQAEIGTDSPGRTVYEIVVKDLKRRARKLAR